MEIEEVNILTTPGLALQWFLMAAYIYYCSSEPVEILSDIQYDTVGQYLYKNWNKFEHRHKRLIRHDSLQDMSSLYYIAKDDYPGIIQHAAISLSRKIGRGLVKGYLA